MLAKDEGALLTSGGASKPKGRHKHHLLRSSSHDVQAAGEALLAEAAEVCVKLRDKGLFFQAAHRASWRDPSCTHAREAATRCEKSLQQGCALRG